MQNTLEHRTPKQAISLLGESIALGGVYWEGVPCSAFEVYFRAMADIYVFAPSHTPVRFRLAADSDHVTERLLDGGSLHFHPQGSRIFSHALDQTDNVVVLSLQPDFSQRVEDEMGLPRGDLATIFNLTGPDAMALADMVSQSVHQPDLRNALFLESAVVMAATFIREHVQGKQTASQPLTAQPRHAKRFVRTMDYIETYLDSDLTLQALADSANMSLYHFLRRFKENVGATPRQYVIKRRVLRAALLLRHSDAHLLEIALQCGFASQSHMSNLFKRAYGMTPSRYRAVMRGN